MHPPDQQREDGGESLHQECVEGSLRAVDRKIAAYIFVGCCRVGFNGFPRYRNKILIMITVIIYYSI